MNKNNLLKRINKIHLLVILALLIIIIAVLMTALFSRANSNDLTYRNDTVRSKVINDYLESKQYPGLACATQIIAYNTLDSYAQFVCTIKKGYTLKQTKLGGTSNVGRFTFNTTNKEIKAAEYPSEVFYSQRLKELLPTDVLKAYENTQSTTNKELDDEATKRAAAE